jgi:drug/metabolite transporter (DMT)-like permease
MFLYLAGLSKTTPVTSSIFTSLQPIWVFLIMIFFYKEKAGAKKIIGISIGLIGASVCILTQQSDDLASDAFTGNMLLEIKLTKTTKNSYHTRAGAFAPALVIFIFL